MKKKSTTPTFDDDAPITQGDIDTGKLVLRGAAPNPSIHRASLEVFFR